MVYDSLRSRAVLFGGIPIEGEDLADTWELVAPKPTYTPTETPLGSLTLRYSRLSRQLLGDLLLRFSGGVWGFEKGVSLPEPV
jgi:hypothetical protein